MHKVAATILTCNNAFLGQAVLAAQRGGADQLHVDIIDGKYASNFSFGPKTIADLKEVVHIPIEVHFELYDPQYYIDMFAQAGADMITVHVEACKHLHRTIQVIKSYGVKAGVVLNPATSLSAAEEILSEVDMVLLMSVNPGFGGQKYIDTVTDKVRRLRRMISERNLDVDIEVDGGVTLDNVEMLIHAGANIFVAGSAVYKGSVEDNVKGFLEVFKKYE